MMHIENPQLIDNYIKYLDEHNSKRIHIKQVVKYMDIVEL